MYTIAIVKRVHDTWLNIIQIAMYSNSAVTSDRVGRRHVLAQTMQHSPHRLAEEIRDIS